MNLVILNVLSCFGFIILLIGAVRFVKLVKTEHKNRKYSFLTRIGAWILVILGILLLPLMSKDAGNNPIGIALLAFSVTIFCLSKLVEAAEIYIEKSKVNK